MTEPYERLDGIAKLKGLRLEQITVEPNEGAPDGYGYGAWVGEFELGCTVGTGRTPEAAIEDLLDQLEDLDNGSIL
jgi:hypothetical protein